MKRLGSTETIRRYLLNIPPQRQYSKRLVCLKHFISFKVQPQTVLFNRVFLIVIMYYKWSGIELKKKKSWAETENWHVINLLKVVAHLENSSLNFRVRRL